MSGRTTPKPRSSARSRKPPPKQPRRKPKPDDPLTPDQLARLEAAREKDALAREAKLTVADRYARNVKIVKARARGQRYTSIAEKFGLTERQVRRIVADHRDRTVVSAPTADEYLHDALEMYAWAIEGMAELAESTDHDSTALGAYRGALEAMMGRLELLATMGRIPRQLGDAPSMQDLQRLVDQIVEALEDAGAATPEVVERLADVVSLDDARARRAA